MPLKLSSAEQPPCKRTVVGSIPTWGSQSPLVAQPGRGIRLRTGPVVVRIHARGLGPGGTPWCSATSPSLGLVHRTPWAGLPGGEAALRRETSCMASETLLHCDVVQWEDTRLLTGQRWFDPSRRSSFLGLLTAGSSALNRRMRGSNPARGIERGGTDGSPTSPLLLRRTPITADGPPGRRSGPPVATGWFTDRAAARCASPRLTDEDMVSKRSPTPSERVRFLPSVLHVPARPRVG